MANIYVSHGEDLALRISTLAQSEFADMFQMYFNVFSGSVTINCINTPFQHCAEAFAQMQSSWSDLRMPCMTMTLGGACKIRLS